MRDGHETTERRRRSVLSYPDLRRRLETDPGFRFARAEQWNGYLPPQFWPIDDDGELCRSPQGRLNQRGKYTCGTLVNDSAQRAALIEISREAWRRDQLPEIA
jgi:hypothetical protein